MDKRNKPIGFFDSGVGGLSVLKEAIKIMPNEDYIYFGDSKNAPYGVKKLEEVKELTYSAVEYLIEKGAKALVIACNTATSAAVAALRVTYPNMPIVGIEPAIKPAVKLNREGAIIIMATPMTLSLKKFNNLLDRYKKDTNIIPMPCAGLVEYIESGDLYGQEVKKYLEGKFTPYNNEKIAALVLGCTHYPFISETLKEIVGMNVPIIDGGMGTAKEIKRRIIEADLASTSKEIGKVEIYNSMECEKMIDISKRLLQA